MVMEDPTSPLFGVRLVIIGVGGEFKVNVTPLLGPPAVVVTTTFPVEAPLGTTTTIEVADQLVMEVAAIPLNVTVLLPCIAPKLEPAIVMEDPTSPLFGVRLVIVVGGFTVNTIPLLGPPGVVTTTLPVVAPDGTTATMDVADQLVMVVATIPLNVTVLVP